MTDSNKLASVEYNPRTVITQRFENGNLVYNRVNYRKGIRMDGKFDVAIKFEITKDGQKFADYAADYTGMDYDQMQGMQHAVIDSLLALGDGVNTKKK